MFYEKIKEIVNKKGRETLTSKINGCIDRVEYIFNTKNLQLKYVWKWARADFIQVFEKTPIFIGKLRLPLIKKKSLVFEAIGFDYTRAWDTQEDHYILKSIGKKWKNKLNNVYNNLKCQK